MAAVADEVIVELEAKIDGYNRKLDSATRKFDGVVNSLRDGSAKIGKHTSAGFSIAAGALGGFVAGLATQLPGAIAGAIKDGLEYASSLGEVAQQLGVTSDELQEFRYIASQVGLEEGEMDAGLRKFTVTLGQVQNGAKRPIAALKELGFNAEEIARLATGPAGTAISEIADKLAKIQNPAQRAAIEIALFGRAGQKLDTLLAGGAAQVDGLRQAAHDLGIVLSEDQIQKADETADKLSQLQLQLKARISGAVADNADSILALADALSKLVIWLGESASAFARWKRAYDDFSDLSEAMAREKIGSWVPDFISDAPERDAKKFRKNISDRKLNDIRSAAIIGPNGQPIRGAKPSASANLVDPRSDAEIAQDAILATAQKGMSGGKPGGRGASNADITRTAREAADTLRRYTDDLAEAEAGILDATAELTGTTEDRNRAERARIELERDRTIRQISADDDLSKQQKGELIARAERTAQIRLDAQAAEARRADEQQAAEDERAAREGRVANEEEVLRSSLDLTTNRKERLAIELRLIDLAHEQERLALEEVLASKTATDAQKEIARARLAALGTIQSNEEAGARRDNASPGEQAAADLNTQFQNMQDNIEALAVDKLKEIGDVIGNAVPKALGLKGIIGQFVGELARMAVQLVLIRPLMNAIFNGGGGGGGGGGFFDSIVKLGTTLASTFGKRAGGGPFTRGQRLLVGERGPEVLQMDGSGSVVPNHRLGHMGGMGGGLVRVEVAANDYFDARVSEVSGGVAAETVSRAAPAIVNASTARTLSAMNRKRM